MTNGCKYFMLNIKYRMHPDIPFCINKVFYDMIWANEINFGLRNQNYFTRTGRYGYAVCRSATTTTWRQGNIRNWFIVPRYPRSPGPIQTKENRYKDQDRWLYYCSSPSWRSRLQVIQIHTNEAFSHQRKSSRSLQEGLAQGRLLPSLILLPLTAPSTIRRGTKAR